MKRPSLPLVLSGVALCVALSGLGLTIVGDNFILGEANSADLQTSLSGTVTGNPELRAENAATGPASYGVVGRMTSTLANADSAGVKGVNVSTNPSAAGVIGKNLGGGPGVSAFVNPGVPPLAVNSTAKVTNLNADTLDGVDSSAFLTPSIVFDEAPAVATSPNPVDPPGSGYGDATIAGTGPDPGPTVTVNVPDNGGGTGYIQVWAQVHANENGTAIALFDVTGSGSTFVAGQDTICPDRVLNSVAPGTLPGALVITPDNSGTGVEGDYGTPLSASANNYDCSSASGPPAAVLLQVQAGTRTFELKYADCLCGGPAEVSHRKLWIAPLRMS